MKRREIGNLLRWLGRGDTEDACAPWTHLLSLYADSQTTSQQARRVEAHLADCARCRASLALLRATTQVAQTWTDVEMPTGLSQRLSLAIAEEVRKQRVGALDTGRSSRRRFGLPQIAFSSAALAVVLVGFYFAANHGHPLEPRPTPVVAVNQSHAPTQLPGMGGMKAGKPALVAVKPPSRHLVVHTKTLVAVLPRDEHPATIARPFVAPPVETVSHINQTVPLRVTHPLTVAMASHSGPLLRPHLKPHSASNTQVAKAVSPSVSVPRDPGLPDDDEDTTPSMPVAKVAAATPAAAQETPVLRLASTLRGLAKGTQTIQPGTDQISVTMARTANYTGAATIVGTSIH